MYLRMLRKEAEKLRRACCLAIIEGNMHVYHKLKSDRPSPFHGELPGIITIDTLALCNVSLSGTLDNTRLLGSSLGEIRWRRYFYVDPFKREVFARRQASTKGDHALKYPRESGALHGLTKLTADLAAGDISRLLSSTRAFRIVSLSSSPLL